MRQQSQKTTLRVMVVTGSLLALSIAGSSLPQVGASPDDRLGPVYPILEPDWSTWLPAQMAAHLRQRPLTVSRGQVHASLRRQVPVFDLPEVKVPRTYVVDPSVRVPHPGTDPLGRVFAAGETLNPMTYLAGFRPILMIDGRSDRQIQWARGILKTTNAVVLTLAGDVSALVTRLGVPVYPAPPLLLERLSITRAPVIVSQSDGFVRVEEVVP